MACRSSGHSLSTCRWFLAPLRRRHLVLSSSRSVIYLSTGGCLRLSWIPFSFWMFFQEVDPGFVCQASSKRKRSRSKHKSNALLQIDGVQLLFVFQTCSAEFSDGHCKFVVLAWLFSLISSLFSEYLDLVGTWKMSGREECTGNKQVKRYSLHLQLLWLLPLPQRALALQEGVVAVSMRAWKLIEFQHLEHS